MAPFFTVFTQKNDQSASIILTLGRYYAPPLVDGVSVYDQNFRDKYGAMNGKYFRFEGDQLLMFDNESIGLIHPQFVLTFDHGVKVSKSDWKTVIKFLDAIFFGELTNEIQAKFEELVPKPVNIQPLPTEKPAEMDQEYDYLEKDDYEFEYYVDAENDLAICQVDKPYTDRPYTLVLRSFSKTGLVPLFTGIYISQSWGVASHDYAFLLTLWKHLEYDKKHGALNLEQRLKDEIEKCTGNPELEPEMYREPMQQVKDKLQRSRDRKRSLLK
jgi:hypothetical protein